jgi:hypothetical protein
MLKEHKGLLGNLLFVVIGHIPDKKEPEDLLEEFDVFIVKSRYQLSQLLPCNALSTDNKVCHKLVKLFLRLLCASTDVSLTVK